MHGRNIKIYSSKKVEECKKICLATPNCKAFEFGVQHGGAVERESGQCRPQSSADYEGCDGAYNNLDLYIPQKCTGKSDKYVNYPMDLENLRKIL